MVTSRPDRLPPLAPENMTDAQRQARDELVRGPRGALFGPFVAMLRSPEFMGRAQRLGEYLRYHSALPEKLRELAILVTARHFRQGYEWHVHASEAAAAGLGATVIAALGVGQRPRGLDAAEAVIYEFCTQLHAYHEVADATYAAALALLGEKGVVDLCGVCGYYSMLALIMNVAGTALPAGAAPPPWNADSAD